jgi:hypothetical protein
MIVVQITIKSTKPSLPSVKKTCDQYRPNRPNCGMDRAKSFWFSGHHLYSFAKGKFPQEERRFSLEVWMCAVADWFLVFFFFLQDTTTVAQGLISQSNGRITTGIYHASLSDSHKHQVHTDWREGSIQG